MKQTVRKYVGVWVGYDNPDELKFGALPELLETDFGGNGTIPASRAAVKYYPIDIVVDPSELNGFDSLEAARGALNHKNK
jgi:hypothetical protein